MKKRKIRILAVVIASSVALSAIPAYASGTNSGSRSIKDILEDIFHFGDSDLDSGGEEDEEDQETEWTEWNEETIADVWTTYSITEWKNFEPVISFSTDNAVVHADVPSDWRSALTPIFMEAIESSSMVPVNDKSAYVELLLAVSYQLQNYCFILNPNYGYTEQNENDICFINEFIYPDPDDTPEGSEPPADAVRITSQTQSCLLLYERLLACEKACADTYGEPENLFVNDAVLRSVVQGVLYGPDYCSANYEYSKENANDYYRAHKDSLTMLTNNCAGFADDVSEIYIAIEFANAPVTKQ